MTETNSTIDTLSVPACLRMCAATTSVDEIVSLARHGDETVRCRALKEMCPCRVKGDLTEFWDQVLDMVGDPSVIVRKQVLHTICDGSPRHMVDKVESALDQFNRDPDPYIRRRAHKALASLWRTGKWNIF